MARRRKAHGTVTDVTESIRREVLKRANELLSRKFEPRVSLERRRSHAFNYPIEVFAEGRGWWTVYAGLSLSECFETIEGEELFWPVL